MLIDCLAPAGLRRWGRVLTLSQMWSGASRYEPTAHAFRRHYRRLRKLVLGFVEQEMARRELEARYEPAVIADALMALSDDLCVSRTLTLNKMRTDVDAPIDSVLEGFSRPGT